MRIGLDIDDVICDFIEPYYHKFGIPREDCEITRNVYKVLNKDKDFWLNLPIINKPNFIPELYCTKRIHPKIWTKQFLLNNNIPLAPVYQIYYQGTNKASRIKGKVDIFIDDSISNFINLNLSGIPCLLMDRKHNRKWGPVGRVYNLYEEDILDCYYLFKDTMYPYFKELVDEYKRS